MHEARRAGVDYLEAVTALLQRIETGHPTRGLYQAAEVQFWWSRPRSTDVIEQLLWFDDFGRPEAAAFVTDFGDGSSLVYEAPVLVVLVMPGSGGDQVAHVVDRAMAHLDACGIEAVETEVDQTDDVIRRLLSGHGFTRKGNGVVECWIDASDRPEVSRLSGGYQLRRRSELTDRPHHLAQPHRPEVEQRLQQTSLYRADLDLVVLDPDGRPAAHGLFWHDPVTATGVIEPLRTGDDHQGRGLARHLLTAGIDLLARAGAERISIGFEPDNPVSSHLYLDIGFEPRLRTDVYARPPG